ncbi:MAG: cation:proton antiporter [Gammaproteobacteria bacterium]|nr:MAG: cation:proton antiporter [Gammaproteobacteria bacterium]
MQAHTFFLYLLIILLSARLFAELAVRLKSPSVIGELFAGIVIGPSLFGWIEPVEALKLMAEIGIILLLFEVGLSTDVKRLIRSGTKSTIVAIMGFIAPLLFGFSIAYWFFDLSLLISLFIGGTLTATSIGITVRVLTDLKLNNSHQGQIVLGAAVLDDILGVMLLALLYEFSIGGGVNWLNALKVLVFVSAFFMLAPILAKFMSVVIKRFHADSEIPGLIPTTIVSLVLFFAWLAHAVGAPELLGGFAAGLALSRRFFLPLGVTLRKDEDFAKEIEHQMQPIISLFTPIFFVVVGLSINLRDIDWSSSHVWVFSSVLLVAAIAGKLIGSLFIRENLASRIMIGMSMVPRGEVGLIFAELGRFSGIFNNEIHAGMVIVIVLTTIIPPFTMKWFYKHYSQQLLESK